jgi:glycerol-3-phosphate dehydrogenase
MNVVGTKYTTARAVAERVTTRALALLKMAAVPCRTAVVPLPGGSLNDVPAAMTDARRRYDATVPSDTIPHVVAAYGSRYPDVLDLAHQHPELAARVSECSPVIGAELAWAARHEMVMTLADAVLRRTPLGSMGHPGAGAIARAAAVVGRELGWADDRIHAEAANVAKLYD